MSYQRLWSHASQLSVLSLKFLGLIWSQKSILGSSVASVRCACIHGLLKVSRHVDLLMDCAINARDGLRGRGGKGVVAGRLPCSVPLIVISWFPH